MSDEEELNRSTINKSMAVGGELMRRAVFRVLQEEFASMTDGVDLDLAKQRIYDRIQEIPLP